MSEYVYSPLEVIPKGLCQCGCGSSTSIANRTVSSLGYVKGEPRRFIVGHASKARNRSIVCFRCGRTELGPYMQKYCSECGSLVDANNRDAAIKRYRISVGGNRGAHIKQRYGLSLDEYDAIFRRQYGRCSICKRRGQKLYVDHNHATGEVRGLLCRLCNSGIGYLRDDVKLLRAAVEYLERVRG